MYCYACIFTHCLFGRYPFYFIVFFNQVQELEVMQGMWAWWWRVVLPGLVFSSWNQRKKARFFCSLRSDPCCRSQWEIRLWLIPGGGGMERDLYHQSAGCLLTCQLFLGWFSGPGCRCSWYSPVTWATTAWEIRLFARNDLISSLITALSLLQAQGRIYC